MASGVFTAGTFDGSGALLTTNTIPRLSVATGTANHVIINGVGGALSSEAQLAVTRGGTGVGTLTGMVRGNGAGVFTASTSTTGYVAYWSDANTVSGEAQLSVSRGGTGVGTLTGVVKGNAATDFTAMTSTANYVTYWSDANTISGEPQLAVSRGGTGVGTLTGMVKGTGAVDLSAVTSTTGYAAYWSDANTVSGEIRLAVTRGGTGVGTLTGVVKGNGTGAFTDMNGLAGGAAYWSDANTIASTAVGTSGYVLQSAGAGAPTWINATDANTATTIAKRGAAGVISFGTTDVTNLVVNSDVAGTGKITIDAIRLGAPTMTAPVAGNSQTIRVSTAIETSAVATTTILTIPTTVSYCGSVDAVISGSTTGGSNCVIKITARYQRAAAAGSPTVSTPAIVVVDTTATIPTTTATIVASGANILVRVVTDTVTTMYWIATVDIQHRYYG